MITTNPNYVVPFAGESYVVLSRSEYDKLTLNEAKFKSAIRVVPGWSKTAEIEIDKDFLYNLGRELLKDNEDFKGYILHKRDNFYVSSTTIADAPQEPEEQTEDND